MKRFESILMLNVVCLAGLLAVGCAEKNTEENKPSQPVVASSPQTSVEAVPQNAEDILRFIDDESDLAYYSGSLDHLSDAEKAVLRSALASKREDFEEQKQVLADLETALFSATHLNAGLSAVEIGAGTMGTLFSGNTAFNHFNAVRGKSPVMTHKVVDAFLKKLNRMRTKNSDRKIPFASAFQYTYDAMKKHQENLKLLKRKNTGIFVLAIVGTIVSGAIATDGVCRMVLPDQEIENLREKVSEAKASLAITGKKIYFYEKILERNAPKLDDSVQSGGDEVDSDL